MRVVICDSPPLHSGKKLLTSKSDSSSHGFGTKIIEKYTDINNGRYEWFYDEKERRFHLLILFRQSEEVDVKIIDVDYDRKRISLSMKALIPNPNEVDFNLSDFGITDDEDTAEEAEAAEEATEEAPDEE